MEVEGTKAVIAIVAFFAIFILGGLFLSQFFESLLDYQLASLILGFIICGALGGLISFAIFSFPDPSSIVMLFGLVIGLIVAIAIWASPFIITTIKSLISNPTGGILLCCCCAPLVSFILIWVAITRRLPF